MKKNDLKTSVRRSWEYVHPDFADDLAALRASGDLRRDGVFPMLWKTKQKFVLHTTAPSGLTAAFKIYDRLKSPRKFFLRHSPAAAEAINYQLVAAMGIAAPRLLAAGDTRSFGRLQYSFLVTEFAEGYRDGRDFWKKELLNNDFAGQRAFVCRAMELLARCHDHGILHRGYTPANLLYRRRETPDAGGNILDLMWIDVASCRRLPRWLLKRWLTVDFVDFFYLFDFDAAQRRDFLNHYIAASENPLLPPEQLADRVEKALRERIAR